jgi:hypothetical protein
MTADSVGVALAVGRLVGVTDRGPHLSSQRPGHVAHEGWEYDVSACAVVIDVGVAEHRVVLLWRLVIDAEAG